MTQFCVQIGWGQIWEWRQTASKKGERLKIMCKFSVIDNNYLPVAISQDGLVGGCRGFGSCFIGEGSQE